MDDPVAAPVPRRRTVAGTIAVVVAALLLGACLLVCAAGIPDAVFGRLQAAFPCGDADLDTAHPACVLADPDRARIGLLLVLPLPVGATVSALVAAIVLVVRRRLAIAAALMAPALVLSLAALLEGRGILAVELHRIVRLPT